MTPDDLERHAWLRLTLTEGVGDLSARRLLARFGLPQHIFTQSRVALMEVVTARQADALLAPPAAWAEACKQTDGWLAEGADRHMLTLSDAGYPHALLQTADPPVVLYARGRLDALSAPLVLAMVGSRNPTPQGAQTAHDLAQVLAAQGVCIVSGLALGIDGAAHRGALDAGGLTVAVVGTGLDRVYPRSHRDLAHAIACSGLLLSEFPLGTPPLAAHFPKRNRIIAGVSRGTLVVEAALASGSLITARCASDMGREVLAIPGSIHSPQSKGCHALIRQGAKLVETAAHVLEEFEIAAVSRPPAGDQASDAGDAVPSPVESPSPLLDAMGFDPVGLDALQARTGWSTAALQAQLLELELDGWISPLAGGQYQRVGRA
jgi:DNA processing protein